MNILYKEKDLPVTLQAGDVILYRNEFIWYRPATYLSWCVRQFTQCLYNHCAQVVEDNGELFLNEAVAGGVIGRPLQPFLEREKSYICVLRPRPAVDRIPFSIKADSKRGVKYDVTSLIVHQLVYRLPKLIFGKRYGPWIGSTGKFAVSKMVCSEYVSWCFDLPQWWLNSTREVLESDRFSILWQEELPQKS